MQVERRRVGSSRSEDERLLLVLVSFASSNLNIEHIFFWRKNTHQLAVIGAYREIGCIEVQNHLVSWKDFRIDISSSFVRLFPVCFVFEGDEQGVAQKRFVPLDRQLFPIHPKMKFPISNIAFVRSFVG